MKMYFWLLIKGTSTQEIFWSERFRNVLANVTKFFHPKPLKLRNYSRVNELFLGRLGMK